MQRAYIDGFVEEELLEFRGGGAPPRQEPVPGMGNGPGDPKKYQVQEYDPVEAGDAELRRMGLRVIDGG